LIAVVSVASRRLWLHCILPTASASMRRQVIEPNKAYTSRTA
jgi:hypothetical protein